ncbi:hypothetical protein Golomagni_04632 [Golovinomyces magnicellulatus]|nr:hypothetical protein Golomagni_04632 [Golovinomyces magnicellulatus]
MAESRQVSLDGSSIKPVSSLRSHFEQMSNVKPSIGAPVPRSTSPKPIISLTKGKATSSHTLDPGRFENQETEEPYLMHFKNSRETSLNQGNDKDSDSRNVTSGNLILSPNIPQVRPSAYSHPSVTKLPLSSPSNGKIMNQKTNVTSSKYYENTSPEKSSPESLKISDSFQSSKLPGRPVRIASSQPPSPPPPRRSTEHRRSQIGRSEKPKISRKPASLALPIRNITHESPGFVSSVEDSVQVSVKSPSNHCPHNHFSISNLPIVESSGNLKSNEEPMRLTESSIQNKSPHFKRDDINITKSVRDQILPQITGDQRPALPVRSTAQIDSHKINPAQTIFHNSKPVAATGMGIATERLFSNLSHSHSISRPREHSDTDDRSSNRIPDFHKDNSEQFPDPSLSNRRPPYFKNGTRDISTKYETRILDVCGEYVCTSGHITRVWSLHDGEIVASFAHTEGVKVTSIAFKPAPDLNDEGSNLWLGNSIGDLLEINILSQSLVDTKANAHARREVIKIYRHYHDMWTLDNGGTLLLWAADSKGSLCLKNHAQSFRVPKGHTFSIVAGNELWHATGKELRIYLPTVNISTQFQVLESPLCQPNTGDITSGTTMSSHPEEIFFGHADGKISIYSRRDYACLRVISVSIYKITSLAGIAGNLWAGFSTGTIFIYDIDGSPWVIKKDWCAHQGPVIKLVSDPSSCWLLDREQVVTLGQDNMLRVWDGLLEDDFVETQMHYQESDFCESKDIRVLIMTWNAGASTPFALQQREQDVAFFRNLILSSGCPDILVFGFQELVDLEDKKAVTKSFFKSKKKDHSMQEHMSHQYRDWRDFLTRCLDDYMPRDELYHQLHTASLVGLFTCIFVRAPLIDRIRSLNSAEVKRGLGGLHGNKGALVIRFLVDDTSICFVNCHLAAGQSGTKDRNADITAILEASILPSETNRRMRIDNFICGGDGTMILDHEICIVNGDLNYRIDTMSRDTVINAIRSENFKKLLERDQLLASKKKNPWFKLRAFQELPITFAPTYKYDVGTDTYDTSDKKRSPAWCDRILYRGGDRIEQLNYQRHEVRVSDHRPVTGSFQINVKRIFPKKRAMKWDEVQKQQSQRKEILTRNAMQNYLTNIIGFDSALSCNMIQKHRGR